MVDFKIVSMTYYKNMVDYGLQMKHLLFLKRNLIFRNPINHPSVGFIKNSIINLKGGGYRNNPFYEDYDLWIRALSSGLIFKNLETPLVAMRITTQRDRRNNKRRRPI